MLWCKVTTVNKRPSYFFWTLVNSLGWGLEMESESSWTVLWSWLIKYGDSWFLGLTLALTWARRLLWIPESAHLIFRDRAIMNSATEYSCVSGDFFGSLYIHAWPDITHLLTFTMMPMNTLISSFCIPEQPNCLVWRNLRNKLNWIWVNVSAENIIPFDYLCMGKCKVFYAIFKIFFIS